MNAALALLVNCQCDLKEEGKEVCEAFRAEISPTVYRGADGHKGCSQPARPGDQEKSHKTTLTSLSPGSSGKWKTNGMWITSVCFSLENEPFSLAA